MKTKLLVLGVLFAPGLALAGTPIDETRKVDADARIEVNNVKGAVNVVAWDKNEVSISGTLGDGARRLAVEGGESSLNIRVEGPDKSKGWFNWGSDSSMQETILNIKVPRTVSLEVGVVSATVAISELSGGEVAVDSVSGRIRVSAVTTPRLRLESVSGDVEFDGKSADTSIESVSGDIVARGVGGNNRYETVSGNVRISAATPLKQANASTVSGDIEISGALDKGARIELETMSGDVRLNLPANLSARIEAESFSGTLRSDFGTVEKPEHGPGSSLKAKAGDGDGDISIDSFSGNVTVRRE
ncbi:putative adhesin [Tahibacter aquaticus]|uniref:Putative adhesin n=1 Tax=Tahibacter aquaticus TaxID=520092 RepID=A0A4R6Z9K0_9GAMM|nr:DUF4097 family beta strand repeat-containing protein [Tahibacter aquaticus]TDR48597.1 putative adhesin [Tahibacter aquaticus]